MRRMLVLICMLTACAASAITLAPGRAAAATVSSTIAGAQPISVPETDSGGGVDYDAPQFWQLPLVGGDVVQFSVSQSVPQNSGADSYTFELLAPGTTDTTFPQATPVVSTDTNSNASSVITLQAPYTGVFILAVCGEADGENCSADDEETATTNAYSFSTALVPPVIGAAQAAQETRAGSSVASASGLTLGGFEAGGGGPIDFWTVPLVGGDEVQFSVTDPVNVNDDGYGYYYQLFAPGTTDTTFPQKQPLDSAEVNSSPDVVDLQAPYTGTFVLAICQDPQSESCTSVYSGSGENPMLPYTYTTALVGGGVTAAQAAGETGASPTIAGAQALSLDHFEAGGGTALDFWTVSLAAGDEVHFHVTPGPNSEGDYDFELYAPGTNDTTFPQHKPVATTQDTEYDSSGPTELTLKAPYTGDFVLAACENIETDCRDLDSGTGTNPMNPYTFTTSLQGGAPPKAGSPTVSIRTELAEVLRDRAHVRETCAAAGCTGSVTLTAVERIRVGRGRRRHTVRRTVEIGTRSFSQLAAGSHVILVHLNRTGGRLLRRGHGRLSTTATVRYKIGTRTRSTHATVRLRDSSGRATA
jgi:hypothetical protein